MIGIWNITFLSRTVLADILSKFGCYVPLCKDDAMGDKFHYVFQCTLQWSYNGHNGVSNHQPHDCLLNRLFRRRSKKTLKLRVTGLCEGKSSVTGEFPAPRASNAENVSIWWRHHEFFSSDEWERYMKDRYLQHTDHCTLISVYTALNKSMLFRY